MHFNHPLVLLLLIPVAILLWWSFRQIHGMMKARKGLAISLRFLLVAALILALAKPESRGQTKGTCTFFLVDRSESISEEDQRAQLIFINQALKHLGGDDQAGVIVFGESAQVEILPGKHANIDRLMSDAEGSSSNIAAAIRLASALFPEGKGKRIVVLSDGNETDGDSAEAAEVAATEKISIDYRPFGAAGKRGEIAVTEVKVPSETRVGEKFEIKVTIDSSITSSGILTLETEGYARQTIPISVTPGTNQFSIPETVEKPGFRRYRVEAILDGETDRRNNIGTGFVAVRDRSRVLVLQSDPSKSELANALQNQDLVVDLAGPGGVPFRADQLLRYDAVILNDLNATSMPPSSMKLLQSAVRDSGVGLAMVGGENSFLPGGWYGTPVAEALPVDLNVRQRKTFPSTSILIVVDCSGSMSMPEDGVPKIRLAAKAAEETVKVLSTLDRVGVMGSTDQVEMVAPMQPLTNKESVISQVRRLSVGGGGIYCLPSFTAAEKILSAEQTRVRHLIFLGDGSDCDQQEGCALIAARMRSQKITTTTVSIGQGPHTNFLRQMAAMGGGNHYVATRASQLPAIFTQDAAIMSRSAIEEGAFLPKIAIGEPALRGISSNSIPALFGYCLTDSRPLARVGMKTQKDDPLFASWQYGLGQSLAFTSDAQSRWARAWVGWKGFGQFWGQAVKSMARRSTQTRYSVSTQLEGAKGKAVIRGIDANGNPVNVPPKQVRLSTPSGNTKQLDFRQTGPGEFVADVPSKELGTYIITVAEESPSGPLVSSSGFSVPYPPEYRSYRTNGPLLARIAELGNGQNLTDPKLAVRPNPDPGFVVRELWPWLLGIAMLLLPLDIASRRLALPIGAILATLARRYHAWRGTHELEEQAAEVGRLSTTRTHGESPSSEPATRKLKTTRSSATPAPLRSKSASTTLLESRKKRKSDGDPK